MKKQTQIINRQGQVVALIDEDSDAIIPDGHGIRVPMMLQDGVPTADTRPSSLLHRPGYVYDAGDNEAPARAAYEAMKVRMSNAWRTGKAVLTTEPARPIHNARPAHEAWPGPWKNESAAANPKPPDVAIDATDSEAPARAAYEAMKVRVCDAWRTVPDAREANEAGLQDTRKTRPSVMEDKAQRQDAADAAWQAMVRRTENAWRTGGTR